MNLGNVFIVVRNGEVQKSKRGKLFHHAKQHASSSIKQLVKDEVRRKTAGMSRYLDFNHKWEDQKRVEKEILSEFQIREFKLVEVN